MKYLIPIASLLVATSAFAQAPAAPPSPQSMTLATQGMLMEALQSEQLWRARAADAEQHAQTLQTELDKLKAHPEPAAKK